MQFFEACERCKGHGTIQEGSLEGNDCGCIQGRVLTQEGRLLADLIAEHIKENA